MKTRQLETKLKPTLGLTRHLISAVLFLAAISLICARASAQNLFAVDAAQGHINGIIHEFTPNGVSSTFASSLNIPENLAFDKAGNLFVADAGSGHFSNGIGDGYIAKFTPDGVRTIFASGLAAPVGLAFDSQGNLFVAAEEGAIYKFTPTGARATFATGLPGAYGLAFDRAGNLFVAAGFSFVKNDHAGTVYKFTPTGVRTTFASGLNSPFALAFDSQGDLFVADQGYGYDISLDAAVYKFAPSGERSTVASENDQVPVIPNGLAIDTANNLFVSDGFSSILRFTPSGVRTTFASGMVTAMAFQPLPAAPLPAGPRSFSNLSTRLRSELGNDVAIGGFIINGNAAKTVIVRACGPSVPVTGNLTDPTLELHDSTGKLIASNDNWTSNRDSITWSGLAPKDPHEAAIVTTLSPGSYTAVVRGVSNTSGIALVEVYDLSGVTDSKLANISTRGKVETGDDMMIGGFVIGGDQPTRVLVRVIGPSLASAGIADALSDSVLQLFNSSGTLIFENDDWRSAQQDQIEASGLAPADNRESAIAATIPPGSYTAVVRGKNDTTGVALVEIYNLETN